MSESSDARSAPPANPAADAATRLLGPHADGGGSAPGPSGDRTLGSYRLIRPLGRGGMGVVYLAEDTHRRRQAAVKVMLPEAAADRGARERFVREARAAAAVRN